MIQSFSPLLALYMGRRFWSHFILIFGILGGIIFLLDAVELMRRLIKYDHFTVWRMLSMSALKFPQVMMEVLPFTILIAAVFALWRLTRTSELVAIRATGVSAWQFLTAPILIALLLGVFKMMVLNPIAATLTANYEQKEAQYISSENGMINIARTGLWLRQQMKNEQTVILHAKTISMPEWSFQPVTAFFFNKDNLLSYRIDAQRAELKNNEWVFHDAWSNTMADQINVQSESKFYPTLHLPTDISIQDIQSRFASPDTIPFWNIPDYAKMMHETGFNANPLWANFYKLLAEPVLNVALVLLAAALALRAPRMQRNWWLAGGTVLTGFIVFFMGDFLQALGISDKLPLIVAAFAPAAICLLMGLTTLLYLEDG
jgi:lipopolysaccharide export system permease protein